MNWLVVLAWRVWNFLESLSQIDTTFQAFFNNYNIPTPMSNEPRLECICHCPKYTLSNLLYTINYSERK